jgi:hypothetical protein
MRLMGNPCYGITLCGERQQRSSIDSIARGDFRCKQFHRAVLDRRVRETGRRNLRAPRFSGTVEHRNDNTQECDRRWRRLSRRLEEDPRQDQRRRNAGVGRIHGAPRRTHPHGADHLRSLPCARDSQRPPQGLPGDQRPDVPVRPRRSIGRTFARRGKPTREENRVRALLVTASAADAPGTGTFRSADRMAAPMPVPSSDIRSSSPRPCQVRYREWRSHGYRSFAGRFCISIV